MYSTDGRHKAHFQDCTHPLAMTQQQVYFVFAFDKTQGRIEVSGGRMAHVNIRLPRTFHI